MQKRATIGPPANVLNGVSAGEPNVARDCMSAGKVDICLWSKRGI